jgi:streptogramin lyase
MRYLLMVLAALAVASASAHAQESTLDPATEKFESFPSNRKNANVRQVLGRKGETWIAESGTERIRVIRHPVRIN